MLRVTQIGIFHAKCWNIQVAKGDFLSKGITVVVTPWIRITALLHSLLRDPAGMMYKIGRILRVICRIVQDDELRALHRRTARLHRTRAIAQPHVVDVISLVLSRTTEYPFSVCGILYTSKEKHSIWLGFNVVTRAGTSR